MMKALAGMLRARCYCDTCGEVFLDVPLDVFISKTSWGVENNLKPKWVTYAVEHRIHNLDHIIMEQSGPRVFISQGIIRTADNFSLEQVKKIRETAYEIP